VVRVVKSLLHEPGERDRTGFLNPGADQLHQGRIKLFHFGAGSVSLLMVQVSPAVERKPIAS